MKTYLGRPKRGTPGEVFPVKLNFSSICRALTNAFARSDMDAEVLHTVLLARGPFVQSGKRSAVTEAAKSREDKKRVPAIGGKCYCNFGTVKNA